ncbi:hypothetical protein DFR24_1410 [Panacagrimonas perspica]|uniref:Tetratricopeptide repeat protein n=1 Tax=Panacagrimonas perspica TaxID=381431 RepID=A0A4R7PE27_9GAMM|nr:hypothetical protein [Panacagrimonas perspica]TDU32022.1 hypothetical protein DFR24_1410 [Panacagrimonas perspica]THD04445.1 hypothetical protein B1810_05420 [Panacagrimonas perspica]
MRRLLAFAIALLLSGGAALAAADKPKPGVLREGRQIRDLHYGDVLFHFYQDDFFNAIVGFTAARQMGRAEPHAADGELLLGGMLLSYGQHQQASQIFQALLDSGAKQEIRDRAWFFLSRVSFDRGSVDRAQDSIGRITGKLPGRLEDERRLLEAQVLMGQQRYAEAAAQLADWKGGEDWAGYARFNEGVALVRAERIDEGLKVLEIAGTTGGSSEEDRAIRDRANLALGFAAVQTERHEAARTAFRRVRLEGPWSNQALLGLGWAESAMGHYREALVPWMELQQRDLLDPSVQESMLAIPYAMMGLKAYGQAAQRYEKAIASFDVESRNLDRSIQRIHSGAMLDELFADDNPNSLGGNWQIDRLPATEETRYLVRLMSTRGFQEGLKNYRDLRFVHANLQRWSRDLGTFSDMLATRKMRYEEHLPAVRQAMERNAIDVAMERRAALVARLSTVEQTRDPISLASAREAAQWAQLQRVSQRISQLAPGPQADALRDRARVLQGVLRWNLSHDYAVRLWQTRTELARVDKALAEARTLRTSVVEAQSSEPSRLAGFGKRIDAQGPRVAALLVRTDALLARQRQELQQIAADELTLYKERLAGYSSEAHFALAQVYDRAAVKAPAP